MQKKKEIKDKLFNLLNTQKNLAIADIQKRLELKRSTFIHWVNIFEKEGWIKRKILETEGQDARGRPKTLILNTKKIKEMEKYSAKKWKSFEDFNLKSIASEKILREIENRKNLETQHERLVELFKKFNQDSFGAKIIFLLHSDYIKVNYNYELTEKGKKALRKIKRAKRKASS